MPLEIRFGSAPGGAALARQLQFYVHDIELIDAQGTPHPFTFAAIAPWQTARVALIDLAGDGARNTTIRGSIAGAASGYSAIRFTVGVPFDLNHANPLTAAAPLDRGELFWGWQGGHKFLRADLAAEGREWSFHLGSTGCSSGSALRPPGAPCAQPNLMRVQLAGDPLHAVVRFRADQLVAAMRAANHPACTGDYAHDPACAAPYAATGLKPESGTCADGRCEAQRLWTLD